MMLGLDFSTMLPGGGGLCACDKETSSHRLFHLSKELGTLCFPPSLAQSQNKKTKATFPQYVGGGKPWLPGSPFCPPVPFSVTCIRMQGAY